MTAAPPLLAGAAHDTTDDAFAAPVALTAVGAPGTVDGVTAADADEAEPVPLAFVAVTVNVYEVPFVNPATVHEVVAVVHVNEPGEDVTVYELIEAPPLLTGAVHDTTDEAFAFEVPETEVGAPGTGAGTTAADAADAKPDPEVLAAVTANV